MDIKDLPRPTTHGEIYLLEILKELRALRGELQSPPPTEEAHVKEPELAPQERKNRRVK